MTSRGRCYVVGITITTLCPVCSMIAIAVLVAIIVRPVPLGADKDHNFPDGGN